MQRVDHTMSDSASYTRIKAFVLLLFSPSENKYSNSSSNNDNNDDATSNERNCTYDESRNHDQVYSNSNNSNDNSKTTEPQSNPVNVDP